MVSFASAFDKEYKQYPTPAIGGDFLEQIGKKPEGVVFDRCKIYSEGQPHIKAVYKLLVNEFSMASLKFVCCYWEPNNNGFYRDPKTHYEYMINIHFEESVINDRQRWSEISTFYIVVTTYTEEI